jgi:predicted nuclease of restriction endonuclease-like (RecB) superfamily
MAGRKSLPARASRGRTREGVSFPVVPPRAELPLGYAEVLGEIRHRFQNERLRVVLAASSAMVLLYWEIGRLILECQERAGWGARVIDQLSADLREAHPDKISFSPRNLEHMRAFAAAWPDAAVVQRVVAQLPWRHNITLLEKIECAEPRLWYAEQAIQHCWSLPVLCAQIGARAHEQHGRS